MTPEFVRLRAANEGSRGRSAFLRYRFGATGLSKLSRRDGLRFARRETLPAVGGNGAIDDGAAVDAFPGIEDEKEIRKSLQHHQAFTLWTFHVSPPR